MGGMAGQVPAQGGRSDKPYDPTQTVNHAGQSKAANATCQVMNNVDEGCVNKAIAPGQPTGKWTPFNQCQSFVQDFAFGDHPISRVGPHLKGVLAEP